MNLDMVFFLVVGCFAVVGFFSGFWSQLIRLVALVGAYLLAGQVGPWLGHWLVHWLHIPSMLGKVMGAGLAFLLLYLLLSSMGWAILRARRKARMLEPAPLSRLWERLGGAALGGTKMFVVLYLLLCMLVLMEKPLSRAVSGGSEVLKRSFMAELAREHNLLAGLHLPFVNQAAALGKVASDPGFRERALQDPKVKKLLGHPKIKDLLADRALVSASQRHDIAAILANPRLNQVLEDPEIHKLLSEIDLENVD